MLNKVLVFDGAMGTLLQEKGLKPGACPELMNLEKAPQVQEVHLAYLEAGANVITTNTFGASSVKLAEYGLEDKVEEINRAAVNIAKQALKNHKGYVAASVGPTGKFVEPIGNLSFPAAYKIFREQIEALARAQPDFILLETFSDLGEIRAALLAAKDVCNIPVICCLTFTGSRTLTGVSPASAAVILESMGAVAVGANCSGGPIELYSVVRELAQNTRLPVLVQPNAGLPQVKNGKVFYPLDAKAFIQALEPYFQLGINLFGSCCGSTPLHTKELQKRLNDFVPDVRHNKFESALASREKVIRTGGSLLPKIIGERINPTARKKLAQGLREGDWGLIQNEAELQERAGAHLLDVNVGTPGIDEVKTMAQIINLLQQNIVTPLVIDSTNPQVIAKALETYHGKALVNSVNGEEDSLKKILPLVKRYGAAVIALTLDEKGISPKAEDRYQIAEKIINKCSEYGIAKEDIYVDCLVMTVGTDIEAPGETIKAIKMVKEKLGVNTVLGVSNVSHGLPNRSKINSAFLAMAIANGLDLAIINPLDENMFNSWQSASLLTGRDEQALNYLALNGQEKTQNQVQEIGDEKPSLQLVSQMVVRGSQGIIKVINSLLEQGVKPLEVINQGLVPGLNIVGEKYEKGEYYLPQLMLSAETAQKAFDLLEEFLIGEQKYSKSTVVIGTVKGDVHDIGKNMVMVMLKNHGYKVIDLGKNVQAEEFVEAVKREKAQFLALSALMTTTMQEIPLIIELVKKELPGVKTIVGGAVVTEDFAQEVGADGYGRDAVSAVKIVEELRGPENG